MKREYCHYCNIQVRPCSCGGSACPGYCHVSNDGGHGSHWCGNQWPGRKADPE